MLICLLTFSIVLARLAEQDYFRFPQYELYFQYTSNSSLATSNGNSLKIGKTHCILPKETSQYVKSIPESLPTTKDAEQRLDSMPCIYRVLDGQYWAYQFCYGKDIIQFHPSAPSIASNTDQFLLGTADKITKTTIKKRLVDGGTQVYLEQVWGGGSVWLVILTSDLHGKQRSTVIEYFCGPTEMIKNYMETASCTYSMVVYTPRF